MNISIEKKHLQILKDILSKYDHSFFVFGSRVTRKNKKLSDVDLLYFEDISNKTLLELEEAFEESDLPYKVDMVNYYECDKNFRSSIGEDYICLQASSKLKLVEDNHLKHFIFLPKRLGSSVSNQNGSTMIKCSFGSSMFNIVYGVEEGYTNSFDLAEKVMNYFDNQPFSWWIPGSQHNPNLTKTLLSQGFIMETTEQAMVCDLTKIASLSQTSGLLIKQVTDGAILEDFIAILENYDSSVRIFYESLNLEDLQLNEKLFVGYEVDSPVTIGLLFISYNSAAIFSLLTKESARGKGYGSDMIRFLLEEARVKNCNYVTLSASSDSASEIYKRLGFFKVGEFECFEFKGN